MRLQCIVLYFFAIREEIKNIFHPSSQLTLDQVINLAIYQSLKSEKLLKINRKTKVHFPYDDNDDDDETASFVI